MSLHIIIDGYNLIRQSYYFSMLEMNELKEGRDALIDFMGQYRQISRNKITVVFDGSEAYSDLVSRDSIKGVKVIFSTGGESADTVIKRISRTERERSLVVSSDQDIVSYVEKQGAATIASQSFEKKVRAALGEKDAASDEEHGGWTPTTKKRGPSRRLSKKDRRNMNKIRKL
jgi:uncharacterized protein